jgi:hypothetical protein
VRERIEYRFRVPSAAIFTLYSYSKTLEYHLVYVTAGSLMDRYYTTRDTFCIVYARRRPPASSDEYYWKLMISRWQVNNLVFSHTVSVIYFYYYCQFCQVQSMSNIILLPLFRFLLLIRSDVAFSVLLSYRTFKLKSKIHWRSSNLFDCVIPIPKLINRPFKSSNLFISVNPVIKLSNRSFRSSNLFIYVNPVPKLANRSFRSSNLFGHTIYVPKLANHPFRSSNLFSCVLLVPKYCKLVNSIYNYRTIQKL